MSGRPIVSYDDITLPYDSHSAEAPPPAKKAKSNHHHHHQNGGGRQAHAHWDDPGASTSWKAPQGSGPSHGKKGKKGSNAHSGGGGGGKSGGGGGSGKGKAPASFSTNMSRELTHEEIWDDSALVEAWDAAMEEYEAYNGPGKGWKSDPLVKSALWYNTPVKPDPSLEQDGLGTEEQQYFEGDEGYEEEEAIEEALEAEGELLDAPSASAQASQWPSVPNNYDTASGPAASLSTVSQDEAFSRALNAMYWGGYWTAVYHCHRGQVNPPAAVGAAQEKADNSAEAEEAAEDEGEPERDEEASSDNMNAE